MYWKNKGSDIISCICGKQLWFEMCSKCGSLQQMMAKNTSSVDPQCKKTHILGKHTCQIYPQTIPRKDSQRAIEVSIFGKTKGSTFVLANAANSYGFNYVLNVVSSNKYWPKKHHP